MGGGLGFAAALKGAPPQASALGLVLGASAGAFTGLQLGKMYGNSDRLGSEKAKQGYLDLYANQYAKEHGITLDKAKIELNNFIKAKKKPSTIRKAASFGAMMGKRASLLKSGMTFDAEDYLYDTKPVNFLYNGQPSWMIRDGDTLPPTAWDGTNALSGSMYPVTRKGKLIQEPDEAELKRYYLAGLNKKLQVPGAKARAWYTGSAEVPEKKRRLWGLLPDKLNYDFKDEDFHDIEHGATPEARQEFINRLSDVLHGRPHAGRVEDFQALGEPMGKLAAGEAPASPQPSARDIQIHNARMELQRKGQMVRDAAGGNGAYGTSRGTMKDGVIQPGATFTRQEGQQSQRPLPGAGGQINTPPVPRGMQPVPPASSPVIESKTPRRLF
jgi:hypothetical protein